MLSLTCSENAELYEDDLAAFQRGDYGKAVKFWQPLAKQDVADAQYNLGFMYETGEGAWQSFGGAMKWYREVAEHDYFFAQNSLVVIGGFCRVPAWNQVAAYPKSWSA